MLLAAGHKVPAVTARPLSDLPTDNNIAELHKCSPEAKSPPAKRARPAARSSPKQHDEGSQPAGAPFKLPPDLELLASMFGEHNALSLARFLLALLAGFQSLAELGLPSCQRHARLCTPADALHTGRMMLKRRSEKVTYTSVRHVVENMTKREFRVRVSSARAHSWKHTVRPTQPFAFYALCAQMKPPRTQQLAIHHPGYVPLLVAD